MSADRDGVWVPGKLWSLWEIVEAFDGELLSKSLLRFAYVNQQLGDARTANKPLPINLADVADHIRALDALSAFAQAHKFGVVAVASANLREQLVQIPRDGVGEYFQLDARPIHHIKPAIENLIFSVIATIKSKKLLALSMREQELYEAREPLFGEDVDRAFPGSAAEDIAEAGKCLALGCYTASVFHLMRALEAAVHVVADKLGATVVDEHGRGLGWGLIASNMLPFIDKMPPGSDEQVKWYRVQRELVVVNRAWRVPTNHPKQTYTPDEATQVFDATRGFLKELAPLA